MNSRDACQRFISLQSIRSVFMIYFPEAFCVYIYKAAIKAQGTSITRNQRWIDIVSVHYLWPCLTFKNGINLLTLNVMKGNLAFWIIYLAWQQC